MVYKSDYFRKMYRAHDTIAAMNERLIAFYASATVSSPKIDGMPKAPKNPHRFENTIIKILEMQEGIDDLLKQRACFDCFLFTLPHEQRRLFRFAV